MSENSQDLITLTADIVAAHVSNNSVSIFDIPTLVSSSLLAEEMNVFANDTIAIAFASD